MWLQQVSAAAAIIAVSVVGTGAVALVLRALGVLSGESMSCPICGGATRFHDPYLMCDDCERCVGVRINGNAHASR
jgi:hypothetical protein